MTSERAWIIVGAVILASAVVVVAACVFLVPRGERRAVVTKAARRIVEDDDEPEGDAAATPAPRVHPRVHPVALVPGEYRYPQLAALVDDPDPLPAPVTASRDVTWRTEPQPLMPIERQAAEATGTHPFARLTCADVAAGGDTLAGRWHAAAGDGDPTTHPARARVVADDTRADARPPGAPSVRGAVAPPPLPPEPEPLDVWSARISGDGTSWLARCMAEYAPEQGAWAFEAAYAARSGVTVDWLHQHGRRAEPCHCGEEGCAGWQMAHAEPAEIR